MQQEDAGGIDVIIVDNGSTFPLAERSYVHEFISAAPLRRLLQEAKLGKTNAIETGAASSTASAIIIIDDDNLPAPNFVVVARNLVANYPNVGVWGPGVIDVEWQKGSPAWAQHYNSLFLARQHREMKFGSIIGWPDFYPPGAGSVIQRRVMERYLNDVRCGNLNATCRCGDSLSSGGDAQIVWSSIRMGLCAGVAPQMKLVHLIPSKRANLKYIYGLAFNVMADGQIAFAESFPEQRRSIENSLPNNARISMIIFGALLRNILLLRLRSGPVVVISLLGELYGKCIAVGRTPPSILRLAARLFGFVAK
jgi:Glycosyltransferase like family 2